MTSREKKRYGHLLVIPVLALALLLGFAAFYGPKYLAYADNPVKADAVVLFVGPGFHDRNKQARKLIEEGYAHYLLVPAIDTVGKGPSAFVHPDYVRDQLEKLSHSVLGGSSGHGGLLHSEGNALYQHTHLEIITAKRMMSEHGLKSALFVSSPWHMRRIKMISESVFNGNAQYNINFVPTSFEKIPTDLLGLCKYVYKWIIQEYLKIGLFLAYSRLGA